MSNSRARLLCAAASLAILMLGGQPARSETTISDLLPDDVETTLSGSYLAAMSAAQSGDLGAATVFFEEALSHDPKNPLLLDRAFTLSVANGDVDQAFPFAKRLVETTDASRMGQIALAVRDIKNKKYRESVERLDKGDRGEIPNLTASLLSAWAAQGRGETDGALKIIETTQGPPSFDATRDFNRALILDLAGRQDEAVAAIEKAYKADGRSIRVVDAYARILARAGRKADAIAALDRFVQMRVGLPVVQALSQQIASGEKPAPFVSTVSEGAAEVLYGIGAALASEKGREDAGIVYLRLALYLNPHDDIALMALGELFQGSRDFERSSQAFGQVSKTSPFRRTASMQMAYNDDAMGKRDEATRQLKKLAAANPQDSEPLTALGTIFRGEKKYLESADYFTKALDVIPKDDPRLPLVYFFRGISYERANEWPKAEADMKKSLELSPNDPQVLNYLGYSWVDKGINVEQGTDLIKQAVELKPDDGAIVDSLGWAYYKLGRYDQAVAQLERAIALKPDDVTVNDHLGDAYWKVGRTREATFQWAHARDLGPDPEEKARILAKLDKGLDRADESRVASVTGNTVTDGVPAASADSTPKTLTVQAGDSLWDIAARLYGNGELYIRLIEANRKKLADPDHIIPGQILQLPTIDEGQ